MAENKSRKSGNTPHVEADLTIAVRETRLIAHHGENIKHYRTSRGYSQEYMAKQIGISQPRFSELERLEIVDDTYLIKIAELLDLGLAWLKDIPINKAYNNYIQEGSGPNFQNMGDVSYNTHINNPLEAVTKTYERTIEVLESRLKEESRGREELLIKCADLIMATNKE